MLIIKISIILGVILLSIGGILLYKYMQVKNAIVKVELKDNLEADFADASNTNKKKVIGLVSDNIVLSNRGSGHLLTAGLLTGTIEQWEFVTGMVGGLVPDTKYFLDITPGKMTMSPPTDDGQYICLLGTAVTQTIFMIRIERSIRI